MPIPHNQHIIYPAPASLCAAYCVPENQSMPNNSCAMGYECWTTIRNRPTLTTPPQKSNPIFIEICIKTIPQTHMASGWNGRSRTCGAYCPLPKPKHNTHHTALPSASWSAGSWVPFLCCLSVALPAVKNSIPRPKSGGQTESSSLGPYRYCLAGA